MGARKKARSAPLADAQKFVTGAVLTRYHNTVVAPQVEELLRQVAELRALVGELMPTKEVA